jgi:hypothetical protein
MGTKREEGEIERVKIEIHMKHIIKLHKKGERTHIHTNTINNSNELVKFRVREQLSVQMVSWIQVSLAYWIIPNKMVYGLSATRERC